MLWTRAVGGIAVVFGVLFLLHLFAWCTLMPPGLTGWVWWSRVLGTMVSQGPSPVRLWGPRASRAACFCCCSLPTRLHNHRRSRSGGICRLILHAASSETSSNSWKLSVMSEASLFAWVVGTRSRTSWMAARKSAKLG